MSQIDSTAYPAEKGSPLIGSAPISRQPMANNGMNVIQNSQNQIFNKEGERNWNQGLFECGCSDYIMATCCSCIVFSQNDQRVIYMTKNGQPIPEQELSSCTGMCCLYSCLPPHLILLFSRMKIRARYNIAGSCIGDCCITSCCFPCAMAQESAEIRSEEVAMAQRLQQY